MMGGGVQGGQTVGGYPDNLTDDGTSNIGRGRMNPTTPWDAVFKGLATWVGVQDESLDDVCPKMEKTLIPRTSLTRWSSSNEILNNKQPRLLPTPQRPVTLLR